jgi:F0F1-type ATP synthase assembly protein I
MPWGLSDSKDLGFYLSLAQVGAEFVAPLVTGALLDLYLGWSPWGIIVGAVLGFVGGLSHLVILANRQPPEGGSKQGEERTP